MKRKHIEGYLDDLESLGKVWSPKEPTVSTEIDGTDVFIWIRNTLPNIELLWFNMGRSGVPNFSSQAIQRQISNQDATYPYNVLIVYDTIIDDVVIYESTPASIPDELSKLDYEVLISRFQVPALGSEIIIVPPSSFEPASQTEIELSVTTSDISILNNLKYITAKGLKYFKDKFLAVAHTFAEVITFTKAPILFSLKNKSLLGTDSNGNIVEGTMPAIPTIAASKNVLSSNSSGNAIQAPLSNGKIWKGNSSNIPEEVSPSYTPTEVTVGNHTDTPESDYETIGAAIAAGKTNIYVIADTTEASNIAITGSNPNVKEIRITGKNKLSPTAKCTIAFGDNVMTGNDFSSIIFDNVNITCSYTSVARNMISNYVGNNFFKVLIINCKVVTTSTISGSRIFNLPLLRIERSHIVFANIADGNNLGQIYFFDYIINSTLEGSGTSGYNLIGTGNTIANCKMIGTWGTSDAGYNIAGVKSIESCYFELTAGTKGIFGATNIVNCESSATGLFLAGNVSNCKLYLYPALLHTAVFNNCTILLVSGSELILYTNAQMIGCNVTAAYVRYYGGNRIEGNLITGILNDVWGYENNTKVIIIGNRITSSVTNYNRYAIICNNDIGGHFNNYGDYVQFCQNQMNNKNIVINASADGTKVIGNSYVATLTDNGTNTYLIANY